MTRRWRGRSGIATAAVLLAVTACGGREIVRVDLPAAPTATAVPVEPAASPTPLPTPTSIPVEPTPTATPVPPPVQIGVEPPPSAVVLTSTGIPVVAFGATDDGLVVQSPCGPQVVLAEAVTPVAPVEVVIDPGHGGAIDTGAVGANGLVERDLNLAIANRVLDELAERGISATTTRVADYGTTLPVRASIADALGAELLVSIHHNAPQAPAGPVPGTEVFVQTGVDSSARLGGLLHEELTSALSQAFPEMQWGRAPDAGVLTVLHPETLTDVYGMIRRPATPTALVEIGYLANPAEADLFTTEEYQRVAATAIADAVEAHMTTDRPGTGFGNDPRVFLPGLAPEADQCDGPVLE